MLRRRLFTRIKRMLRNKKKKKNNNKYQKKKRRNLKQIRNRLKKKHRVTLLRRLSKPKKPRLRLNQSLRKNLNAPNLRLLQSVITSQLLSRRLLSSTSASKFKTRSTSDWISRVFSLIKPFYSNSKPSRISLKRRLMPRMTFRAVYTIFEGTSRKIIWVHSANKAKSKILRMSLSRNSYGLRTIPTLVPRTTSRST